MVTADDVNQAIGIMGRPEDFGATEEASANNASASTEQNNQSDHFSDAGCIAILMIKLLQVFAPV